MMRRWWLAGVLLVGSLAMVPRSGAAMTLVLPKPGQIGFEIQGQGGTLFKSGNLGSAFGGDGGLAVRVRYRMRYERAFGVSFESQTFDARSPADSAFARTRLTALLSGVELYQLFNTETRTQQMLSVGAGLAQVHYSLRDGETEYPVEGDGVYVSAGGGIERFFYRSLAFDLSGRYISVFQGGKSNHEVQAAFGVIFYASY